MPDSVNPPQTFPDSENLDNFNESSTVTYLEQVLCESPEDYNTFDYDHSTLENIEDSFRRVIAEDFPSSFHQECISAIKRPYKFPRYGHANDCSSSHKGVTTVGNLREHSVPVSFNGLEFDTLQTGTTFYSNILSEDETSLLSGVGKEETNWSLPQKNDLLLITGYQNNHSKDRNVSEGTSTKVVVSDERIKYLNTGAICAKQFPFPVQEEEKYVDEISLQFDKLFLEKRHESWCKHPAGSSTNAPGKFRGRKKQGNGTKTGVDLEALLILCAHAVSADDRTRAYEILEEIKEHATPLGNGDQRCAHHFANALGARLAGSKIKYQPLLRQKMQTTGNFLELYEKFNLVSPFRLICYLFSENYILKLAKKAKKLHIVDFGIMYGLHWIPVIKKLSLECAGKPPYLRITGIEHPQFSFWQSKNYGRTGERLAEYSRRFKVPFEYNGITTQNWERIQIEDLVINQNEVVLVTCNQRLENVDGEIDGMNCPRTAVLKLIHKINPDMFIHSVIDGYYGMPVFLTRFRKALYHFSAIFDIHASVFTPGDEQRLMIERDCLGQILLNIIACEGADRVEKPEPHKRWQLRAERVGFRQLPLDEELVRTLRSLLRAHYHREFILVEEGNWLLQGWKGRSLLASCCWFPIPESSSSQHF